MIDTVPVSTNHHGMPDSIPPSDMRKDYLKGELHESQVAADPIIQFARWFADARTAHVPEPTAMTLATADATGKPSARIVLLKNFDAAGFVFYTSHTSRKGAEMLENPQASLVFFWQELERQVRIDGTVEQVTRNQSEQYFHSRPIPSQIGAWVSHQSSVISSGKNSISARQLYAQSSLAKKYHCPISGADIA